jgi:alpha,alpha-trehalase
MWNSKKRFFFDYNYKFKKQGDFYSIAGFYPLWAKLASNSQAKKIRDNLKLFEYRGGLANTQKSELSKEFKQWDYPNGWANQQWIVIKGLMNYGYEKDAKRLAQKWLELNAKVFEKTGKFWEKYDVVKCNEGKSGRYKNQTGFGWTNAIFVKLIKEFNLKT